LFVRAFLFDNNTIYDKFVKNRSLSCLGGIIVTVAEAQALITKFSQASILSDKINVFDAEDKSSLKEVIQSLRQSIDQAEITTDDDLIKSIEKAEGLVGKIQKVNLSALGK